MLMCLSPFTVGLKPSFSFKFSSWEVHISSSSYQLVNGDQIGLTTPWSGTGFCENSLSFHLHPEVYFLPDWEEEAWRILAKGHCAFNGPFWVVNDDLW